MHTEGLWDVVKVDRGFIITAKDGVYDIAIVRNIGDEDNQANAKLIAAAPDLLQSMQKIKDGLSWGQDSDVLLSIASSAIKKATE